MPGGELSINWIRPLAQPYLRSYRAVAQTNGALRGYWFLNPIPRRAKRASPRAVRSGPAERSGFFVGYLVTVEEFAFLVPQPPECLIFAFVQPVRGSVHRRLVSGPESLLRRTFEYIRWLTHRLPRFVFHADQLPVMTRHVSMRDWPRDGYEQYSRNFFIETLAWLVRSGLVRKLREEVSRGSQASQGKPHRNSS